MESLKIFKKILLCLFMFKVKDAIISYIDKQYSIYFTPTICKKIIKPLP